MNVQQASGQSPHKAISVPAIISHHGEMSPQLFNFIESCVNQFRSAFRVQNLLFSDPDGRNVFQATAHYRTQFKDDIFAALAKGWGQQLAAAHIKGTIACQNG